MGNFAVPISSLRSGTDFSHRRDVVMKRLRTIISLAIIGALGSLTLTPTSGSSAEFVVYSVLRELDLGNPGEVAQKDFYVNMGKAQGVRDGSILTVKRRVSTYDLLSEKLYRDMVFEVGKLKVIHTESNAAVARMEKLLPSDKYPTVAPHAVVVGDLVEISE